MAWKPGPEIERGVATLITRASERSQQSMRKAIAEGAEKVGPFGQVGHLHRTSAVACVETFTTQATGDVLGLFESVYGEIPAHSVDWIFRVMTARFGSFTEAIASSQKEPIFKKAVRGAAVESLRALEIALAPHRIRAAEGIKPKAMTHQTTVYNITGVNSRVSIDSVDSSTNIVNTDVRQLFSSMRDAIQDGPIDESARETLRSRIDAMEAAAGTQSFGQTYADFMRLAASHVTVFKPFFAALSQIMID
jgi:hypothetical protein